MRMMMRYDYDGFMVKVIVGEEINKFFLSLFNLVIVNDFIECV